MAAMILSAHNFASTSIVKCDGIGKGLVYQAAERAMRGCAFESESGEGADDWRRSAESAALGQVLLERADSLEGGEFDRDTFFEMANNAGP